MGAGGDGAEEGTGRGDAPCGARSGPGRPVPARPSPVALLRGKPRGRREGGREGARPLMEGGSHGPASLALPPSPLPLSGGRANERVVPAPTSPFPPPHPPAWNPRSAPAARGGGLRWVPPACERVGEDPHRAGYRPRSPLGEKVGGSRARPPVAAGARRGCGGGGRCRVRTAPAPPRRGPRRSAAPAPAAPLRPEPGLERDMAPAFA